MRITLLLAMAVGASFIGSSCGGSGVGDPCIPEDEYVQSFSGFSVEEVNVESKSFQCLTRVCLANHFQGRVSCPYGQASERDVEGRESGVAYCMACGVDETAADCCPTPGVQEAGCIFKVLEGAGRTDPSCNPGGERHKTSCRIPDRDGEEADYSGRVRASVRPQFDQRQAKDAVYCSCRCAGPDSNARYCECPSGFVCEELVKDQGLGKGQLAGSYCVKEGTEYDPTRKPSSLCSSGEADCGYVVTDGEVRYGVNPPNEKAVAEATAE